jgi:hypothetical protein
MTISPKIISCLQYKAVLSSGNPFLLLDVRNRTQYDICSLSESHNIPLAELSQRISDVEHLRDSTYSNKSKSDNGEKVKFSVDTPQEFCI